MPLTATPKRRRATTTTTTSTSNKATRPSHIAAFCLLAVFCFDSFQTETSVWSPRRMLRARELSSRKDPRSYLATWDDLEQYHEEKESAQTDGDVSEAPAKLPYHPIFWHIPKAGGTSLQDLMSSCLMLVVGNHVGYNAFDQSDELKIVPEEAGPRDGKYVNVDLSTRDGIDHAVDIGLPDHLDMVDVMVTPELQTLTHKILSEEEQGILFTIFRHPVERAVSTFYYLRKADWEPTYHPEWKNWTIEDYVASGKPEKNWMTTVLLGDNHKLNDDTMELAKEVLRNHTVIGLVNEMEESIRRFGRVFGWDEDANFEPCIEEFLSHPSNSNDHLALDPESEEWKKLEEINSFDLELYNYAVELFSEQGRAFFGQDGLLEPSPMEETPGVEFIDGEATGVEQDEVLLGDPQVDTPAQDDVGAVIGAVVDVVTESEVMAASEGIEVGDVSVVAVGTTGEEPAASDVDADSDSSSESSEDPNLLAVLVVDGNVTGTDENGLVVADEDGEPQNATLLAAIVPADETMADDMGDDSEETEAQNATVLAVVVVDGDKVQEAVDEAKLMDGPTGEIGDEVIDEVGTLETPEVELEDEAALEAEEEVMMEGGEDVAAEEVPEEFAAAEEVPEEFSVEEIPEEVAAEEVAEEEAAEEAAAEEEAGEEVAAEEAAAEEVPVEMTDAPPEEQEDVPIGQLNA